MNPAGASSPRQPDSYVLVVDDDPAILTTVSEILQFEGYAVRTATNGAEALRLVEHARPWAILLDMRMPVMDGWGFARALRTRGIDVPIVVMTAAADSRRWAEEIGAAGHVPKPFELLDLVGAVERLRAG
jgi:two-component system chemotaxis response regulator CheY